MSRPGTPTWAGRLLENLPCWRSSTSFWSARLSLWVKDEFSFCSLINELNFDIMSGDIKLRYTHFAFAGEHQSTGSRKHDSSSPSEDWAPPQGEITVCLKGSLNPGSIDCYISESFLQLVCVCIQILDMCAAPGSKTAQLIEMLHSDMDVPFPGWQCSPTKHSPWTFHLIVTHPQ